jgi:hypothetical protein
MPDRAVVDERWYCAKCEEVWACPSGWIGNCPACGRRMKRLEASLMTLTPDRTVVNVELTPDQASWLRHLVERELAADYSDVFGDRDGGILDEVMLRYRDSIFSVQDIANRLQDALRHDHADVLPLCPWCELPIRETQCVTTMDGVSWHERCAWAKKSGLENVND